MKKLWLACLFCLFALQATAEVTSGDLFRTLNERLSYMEDVALFKARNHLPVEDVSRERIVLEKAKASAGERGVDPEVVADFFHAQIAVAKAIQYRYRADWLSRPPAGQPRDLQKEVRPALIRLGNEIIQQLAEYCKNHGAFHRSQLTEFKEAITVKNVTEADKQRLFEALLKVKRR